MSKKFRCVHCGSSQTKKRIKTRDTVCYDCLKVEPINQIEEIVEVTEDCTK